MLAASDRAGLRHGCYALMPLLTGPRLAFSFLSRAKSHAAGGHAWALVNWTFAYSTISNRLPRGSRAFSDHHESARAIWIPKILQLIAPPAA
jgi:hypothetical protein